MVLLVALLLVAASAWAAFPTVVNTSTSTDVDASDGIVVTLPASIVSGRLLVCAITGDDTVGAMAWPGGWTELYEQDGGGERGSGAYRVTDGTEGASITVTSTGADGSASLCYQISGQHASSAPEAGIPDFTGGTANPDPPSVTASWGAEEALFLAIAHISGSPTFDVAPTNYGSMFSSADCSTCRIGAAQRDLNAATDDPGTFTVSASTGWTTNTIVVRGTAAADVGRCSLLRVC